MTFNIRKSSMYDSKPGQLRLRKDGLGGNLLLRGKFPGEDNFPPYTPEFVTNGLISRVELKQIYYTTDGESATHFNDLAPGRTDQSIMSYNTMPTYTGGVYKIESQDYLFYSQFPANFPLGNNDITISLCFMSTIDITSPTFLFFAAGITGGLIGGDVLIRVNSDGHIQAGPVDNLLTNNLLTIEKNKIYSVTLSHLFDNSSISYVVVREIAPNPSTVYYITDEHGWNTQSEVGTPVYIAGKQDISYSPVTGANLTGYVGAVLIYNRFLNLTELSTNDSYFSGIFSQFP